MSYSYSNRYKSIKATHMCCASNRATSRNLGFFSCYKSFEHNAASHLADTASTDDNSHLGFIGFRQKSQSKRSARPYLPAIVQAAGA